MEGFGGSDFFDRLSEAGFDILDLHGPPDSKLAILARYPFTSVCSTVERRLLEVEQDITALWKYPGAESEVLLRSLSGPWEEKTLGLQDFERRLHASERLVETIKRVFVEGGGRKPVRSRFPIRERVTWVFTKGGLLLAPGGRRRSLFPSGSRSERDPSQLHRMPPILGSILPAMSRERLSLRWGEGMKVRFRAFRAPGP